MQLSLLAGVAHAERHALLVGVSRYALFAGDERMQLSGPRNDVQLLRTLLEQRGFAPQAVQVLADGVATAAEPTRAAILSSLDQLVERSRPGDFVFLYFAGHGSQMPADASTAEGRAESDGLHEIFLPADVGRWNAGMKRVDNAIVDHELVRRLDALLDKEAFVWAVFDTCHSATLTRGIADAGIRNRHVPPQLLGVPPTLPGRAYTLTDAPGMARAAGLRRRGSAPGQGGFVVFYAAQTTQTTPEMRLPAGLPDAKVHGLFSYSLAEALSSAQDASYRQLAQHVLGRYAAQSYQTPTPLFIGSHLDAPLFGSRVELAQRQWPVRFSADGLTLQAGLLSQLQVGTELDLLPDPLARSDARLGTFRIARAEWMASSLVPVAVPGAAPIDPAKLPATAVARLARPMQPAFALRVLAPTDTGGADGRAVRKAIAALRERSPGRIDLRWVEAGEAYDLRLHSADGQLWLVPSSGQWVTSGVYKTPSIRIGQTELEVALADGLWRVGRVQNLLRIASAIQDGPERRLLQVDANVEGGASTSGSLDTLAPTPVGGGDSVKLRVRNVARTALDLTVLYVDAEFGITALYPLPRGASNRIEPGASETIVARIDTTTTGMERVLLIAVQARTQGESLDFSFLEQARLARSRSGAGRSDIVGMFEEAGFGTEDIGAGRGARALAGADRTEMRVYDLIVQ